ncbi:amino acid adenylation domain-containing protein [Crocosphaera sp.]|uniref:non-ribosomal peptide synthetase n=1 Tax=Crocosphaera sp. TaxID=2729996 RepID=UPI002612CDAC|nr:amino acid adenylation domain-containing protein [Crocosphaera sp.]MDJ0580940.1 amino acid adenylation domain-containing protein [Crocosphaera sp.]
MNVKSQKMLNESENSNLINEEEELFILPTSFAQERLWLLDKITNHSIAYNSPIVVKISGLVDIDNLSKALQELINRHEILRTTFAFLDENPVQAILPEYSLSLKIVELLSASEEEITSHIIEELLIPFDLKKSPPLRYILFCISPQSYVLIVSMHHIMTDGWSKEIFIRELSQVYGNFCQGKPSPLEPLPIQYGDFAQWQREWFTDENLKNQVDYWQKQLRNAPPILELPTDKIRPPIQTFQGSNYQIELPTSLIKSLKKLSQSQGVTLFTLFMAALKMLLYKWTGQSDLVIGTVIAGRDRSEIESLMGCFMNFLALRSQLSARQTLLDILQQENQTILEAYTHQECPFEKIVEALNLERRLDHNPIYNVALLLHNFPVAPVFGSDLVVETISFEHQFVVLDLKFEVYEKSEITYLSCDYSTDLFELNTIQRLLKYFQSVLQTLVDSPQKKLQNLSILPKSEQQQILVEWNQTQRNYPLEKTLPQLIESQVSVTPKNVAVIFEEQKLTYQQLNQKANKLAHYLRKLGIEPDTLVGICVERSLEMVVGLLGILKAGGAYVPIDPEYPDERLSYMIADSQVEVLLTQSSLLNKLPKSEAKVICLDQDWSTINEEQNSNLDISITADNLAYMIYTSGSTGKPKGAMNKHSGIVNRLLWMQETYQLNEGDRVLQKTPFSFDVSVWEFFWPLLIGAKLVMAQPGGHRDSKYLIKLIQQQQITSLHFVPSMLQIFLEDVEVVQCKSLKRVICSGEALPYDLQERFFEYLNCELHNLYGPTEAAIDVTYWQCQHHHPLKKVPIGRPVANTQLYILDAHLQPVPIGVKGELHIGGVQVGKGYLNQPELTEAKFIPNPFDEDTLLYKTGDLCRHLEDGNIEYLGRIDYQIKLRGFRIELGEIEASLVSHPDIKESVVIATKEQENKCLVAYCVSTQPILPETLREYLKTKLPDYMVPSTFLMLEELPLTPNGKVNRRALPTPDFTPTIKSYVPPQTATEQTIIDIWSASLGIETIGIYDNFFELGGNSLLATKVINRLSKTLSIEISLSSLFEQATVKGLAEYLDGLLWAAQGQSELITTENIKLEEGEL